MSPQQDAAPLALPGYEVLGSLGRGGMGEVFLARQQSLRREVAVKVLRADLPASGWLPERFEREARTMAALHHPNVVTVHDSVQLDDGRIAIVMELVRSGALRGRIAAAPGGLPPAQALAWTQQVAAGLHAAHAAGIIHRDVKPENILIDDTGAARVSDFGMAFSTEPETTRYTQTGAALGTLGYMAPEQLRGGAADARTDVFSLGVVLYEMLTGRLPQGSFSPVSELRPGLSPQLDALVQACLRPDPDRRPTDMAALLRGLDELGKKPRTGSLTRRHVVRGAIAAGIASFAGAGWWLTHRGPRKNAAIVAQEPPWQRLAWPANPAPAAIAGGWRVDGATLHSDSQIAILPVAQEMPAEFALRLRFTRLSGTMSIGVFFRNTHGTAVCTLAGRGRNLGGVQVVDGLALEEGESFEMPLVNGRSYEWTIEIRPALVRMWVDGDLKNERQIASRPLDVPATWEWMPGPESPALLLGSWKSPTRFERLDWRALAG